MPAWQAGSPLYEADYGMAGAVFVQGVSDFGCMLLNKLRRYW
jgi:hypothetical protein